MPDTPHIKRLRERFPAELRNLVNSRFEGQVAVEAMLDDLAEHIERMLADQRALTRQVNTLIIAFDVLSHDLAAHRLTDTAPPMDPSTTEATHEHEPEAGAGQAGPGDHRAGQPSEGEEEGPPKAG